MTYDKFAQAPEKRDRILARHRKTAQVLGAKLVPLELDSDLGIRKQDCFAFRSAAQSFHAIILVRDTNKASLPYIGREGFVPKPIDLDRLMEIVTENLE